MYAIENSHVSVAVTLIQANAEVGRKNVFGVDVLMMAARRGELKLIKLIAKQGLDTRHSDMTGTVSLNLFSSSTTFQSSPAEFFLRCIVFKWNQRH